MFYISKPQALPASLKTKTLRVRNHATEQQENVVKRQDTKPVSNGLVKINKPQTINKQQ